MKINYNSEDLKSHDALGVVIKNSRNQIIMQDHIKYGFWTIPVGKAKDGQDLEDAVKQEIREECGVEISKFRFLSKKSFKYPRNGKLIDVVIHLFEVLEYKGEIENKEPEKHREQKFINIEEIKRIPYLSDATLMYLEYLAKEPKI